MKSSRYYLPKRKQKLSVRQSILQEMRGFPSTVRLQATLLKRMSWIFTMLPMMQMWPVKRPLNMQSAATTQITALLPKLRSQVFWSSSPRNGFSMCLPTPSSRKPMMAGSPRNTRRGHPVRKYVQKMRLTLLSIRQIPA